MLPSLALFIAEAVSLSFWTHFIYFTLWGSNMILLSTIMSILASLERFRENKLIHRLTGILFEISLSMQLVITLVFWTLLLEHTREKLKFKDENTAWLLMLHAVAVHSFPLVAISFNTAISKTVFTLGCTKHIIVMNLAYGLVNFIGS